MLVLRVHRFDMEKIIKLAMSIKYKNQFLKLLSLSFHGSRYMLGGRHIIPQLVAEVINIHDKSKFSTKAAHPDRVRVVETQI